MLNTLEDVGREFGQLAQHEDFNKAAGAIDGCHIWIKPPKHNQLDYFNYKQFTLFNFKAFVTPLGDFWTFLLVMEVEYMTHGF